MSGIATLTISHPTSSNLFICAIVASASLVSVLVIDCILIGLLPPILTLPTLTSLDCLLLYIFSPSS